MQRLHTLQDNLFKIGAPYLDKKTKQYTDLPLGDFPFAIGILYQTNVSQNEIAELMGVTGTTLSRWYKGEKLPPRDFTRAHYYERMLDIFPQLVSIAKEDLRGPLAMVARDM